MTPTVYGGLDLAASPRGRSATAIIQSGMISVSSVWSDDEIVSSLSGSDIVAIDSPLTPPRGGGHREVDRLLIQSGFRVLPASWPSMRALYARATTIAARLRGLGIDVIETHPASALKSSGCRDLDELIARLGLTPRSRPTNRDERDAVVAAVVALAYDRGFIEAFRAPDGVVYLLKAIC
ncbi:MAG: DUF429 domain-containing protein [Acidilobus sp.]